MTLLIPPSGPPFDATVIAETARIHERAGFDRVLIGYFSDAPDGFLVGAHAASVTERLSFLLAHRPGFMAPPVAARKLATLDQLSDGRLAVHIIAGGSDAECGSLPAQWQVGMLDQRRHGETGGPASFENGGGGGVGDISPISAFAALRSAVANPSVNRS